MNRLLCIHFPAFLFYLLLSSSSFAQDSLPLVKDTPTVDVAAVTPKQEPAAELNQEPLRDPFWPVGFFPKDWQDKPLTMGVPDMGSSGWKSARAKIRISGTSRLGGKTAAIINGELRGVGDQIEILHEGKTYQWEIVEITADGQVELRKIGIR